jgi:hypothetical protein
MPIALITLQAELQLLSGHGLVGARRMKIVRVEQTAVLPKAMIAPHTAIRARTPVSAHLATTPRGALPPPKPEPAELDGLLNAQRVHLRGVGETMADEAGNLYEVHGRHMRPFGALVPPRQELRPGPCG